MNRTSIDRRTFIATAFSVGALAASTSLTGCDFGSSKKESPGTDLPSEIKQHLEKSYDVIVVGSGGAGMSAALGAYEKGAQVLILEKMGLVGGNSNFAEGGMNAAATRFQKEQGIEDTPELFAQETIKGDHGKNDPELVKFLADHSSESIDWLDGYGLTLNKIGKSGGFSVPRLHRPQDGSPVGAFLVAGLSKLCQDKSIPLLTSMHVQEVVSDNGVIKGVKASYKDKTEVTFTAPAVVLATGGFGANQDMVTKYRPDLKGTVTTNMDGAQGEGIKLATDLGAATVDLDQIQIHPTVEQSTARLLTEAVRGDGAVLINANGNRFVDELLTRDKVSAAELEQPGKFAFCVFDDKVTRNTKSVEKEFIKENLALVANSLEELGKLMGVDAQKMIADIEAYNNALAQNESDPFGRTQRGEVIDTPPFVAIKIAPGIHHCMGGLKINTRAQVLNESGTPIPGLFACGEVTGGVHGANRIGGNAVCDIVTYGRTSSDAVMEFVKKA